VLSDVLVSLLTHVDRSDGEHGYQIMMDKAQPIILCTTVYHYIVSLALITRVNNGGVC
jgi:hypothetical protein